MDINNSPINGLDYRLDHSFVAFNLLPQYYKYLTNFRLLQSTANQNQLFWNNVFLNNRLELQQQTYITGQTATLEGYLNEKFDFIDRRIEIINANVLLNQVNLYRKGEKGDVNDQTFLFNKTGETDPVPTFLFNKNEVILEFDFKILVPNELISLGLDINQLKVVVDKYKTVGTIYTIEYF